MTEPKCLYPDCQRKVVIRGLCKACYQCARKAILQGATTWEQLERAGKVKPSLTNKGGKLHWFMGK